MVTSHPQHPHVMEKDLIPFWRLMYDLRYSNLLKVSTSVRLFFLPSIFYWLSYQFVSLTDDQLCHAPWIKRDKNDSFHPLYHSDVGSCKKEKLPQRQGDCQREWMKCWQQQTLIVLKLNKLEQQALAKTEEFGSWDQTHTTLTRGHCANQQNRAKVLVFHTWA